MVFYSEILQGFKLNRKLEDKKSKLVLVLKDNHKSITLTYENDIYECILNNNIPVAIVKYKKNLYFTRSELLI